LAAVFCALAAGIKLWGFSSFWRWAVPAGGWLRHHLTFRRAALRGALFIGVMAVTLVALQPILAGSSGPRPYGAIMTDLNQTVSVDLPGLEQPGAEDIIARVLDRHDIPRGKVRLALVFVLPGGFAFCPGGVGPRRATAWMILGGCCPWRLPFFHPAL